ncbi:MAG: transporter substrate-binding domain-containing protein [Deltaproteobacteria bacterium]|nr:transporter substrate-binding domain-containing protein [Deltaproteobacteria bacterium]MBW2141303.1 transporter substrate-binding domain-containing protein [Deltaproteobacteria bacterium]
MIKRLSILTILFFGLIIGLAGEVSAGEVQKQLAAESTVEQVLKRGILRVGMSTFVPWAMKDKTGKLIGFEVDVATRLAKDMGIKVEFVPTKWSGIIPALLTGKFDVIIGGMTIRSDRNFKVNFTIPYDYSGQTICAHKKLAAGFKTAADFNRSEVKIGVRLGSTSAPAVRKNMPKAQLLQFNEEPQIYQELLNGNIHAAVASLPMPAYQALKYPDKLFAITEPFTKELIGFAVRKGDYDTINYFNSWIRQVEAEGWLQERHNYWFNTRDWDSLIK